MVIQSGRREAGSESLSVGAAGAVGDESLLACVNGDVRWESSERVVIAGLRSELV